MGVHFALGHGIGELSSDLFISPGSLAGSKSFGGAAGVCGRVRGLMRKCGGGYGRVRISLGDCSLSSVFGRLGFRSVGSGRVSFVSFSEG